MIMIDTVRKHTLQYSRFYDTGRSNFVGHSNHQTLVVTLKSNEAMPGTITSTVGERN